MRRLVKEYVRSVEAGASERGRRMRKREAELAWLRAAPLGELEAELAALRRSQGAGGAGEDGERGEAARKIQREWRARHGDPEGAVAFARKRRLEAGRRSVDGPAARYQVDLMLRVDQDAADRLGERIDEATARMKRRWKLEPPANADVAAAARELDEKLKGRAAARAKSMAAMESVQRARHSAQLASSRVERLTTVKLGSEVPPTDAAADGASSAADVDAARELHEYHLRTASLQRKLVELVGARRANALVGRDFALPTSSKAAAAAEGSQGPTSRPLGALETFAARSARIDDSTARSWAAAREEVARNAGSVRGHADIRASVDRALGLAAAATAADLSYATERRVAGSSPELDALRKIAQAEREVTKVVGDPAWFASAREALQRKLRGELDAEAVADARRRGAAAGQSLLDKRGNEAAAAVAARSNDGTMARSEALGAREIETKLGEGAANGMRRYRESVRAALEQPTDASSDASGGDFHARLERRLKWLDETAGMCLRSEDGEGDPSASYVTQASRAAFDAGVDVSSPRFFATRDAVAPDAATLLASLDREELAALMERLSPAKPAHFGIAAEMA